MADQKITDFPVLSQGGVDVLNDVIPIVDVNLDLNKKITPASIVGAVLPNPGPIGASTPNTGDFTDVTIDNLTVTGSFVYNIDANDLTGTTLASNVINSSLENTKPATGKFVVGDPLINGNSHLEINGGDTGSGDGAYITIQNDGTDIIAIGNKSAIVGGSYNASPYVYATTTIEFSQNLNLAAGTTNGVAYLNGSKVLTTGTGLTFDGNNLLLGQTSNPSSYRLAVTGTVGMTGDFACFLDGAYTGYVGKASALVSGGSASDLAVRSDTNLVLAAGGATGIATVSSSGLALAGNLSSTGNIVSGGTIKLDAASGFTDFGFLFNGLNRWIFEREGAEGGGNSGSNLYLYRYDDNGIYLGKVFDFNRATGAVGVTGPVGITGIQTITANSSSAALTVTQSGAGPVLNLSGLPTSAAGLSAGDIWNDSGTLKVV